MASWRIPSSTNCRQPIVLHCRDHILPALPSAEDSFKSASLPGHGLIMIPGQSSGHQSQELGMNDCIRRTVTAEVVSAARDAVVTLAERFSVHSDEKPEATEATHWRPFGLLFRGRLVAAYVRWRPRRDLLSGRERSPGALYGSEWHEANA